MAVLLQGNFNTLDELTHCMRASMLLPGQSPPLPPDPHPPSLPISLLVTSAPPPLPPP